MILAKKEEKPVAPLKPFSDGRPRELIWEFDQRNLNVLVPKRRGEGYLRTPLGHHASPLSGLSYDIGHDIFGLDGMLVIDTGYVPVALEQEKAAAVLGPISKLLGFPFRQADGDEFWRLHPLKSDRDWNPVR